MNPQIVWLITVGVVIAAVAGFVIWGQIGSKKRKGAKPQAAKSGTLKPGPVKFGSLKTGTGKPAKPAKAPKPADTDLSADDKKYMQAKKRFTKAIDKRILREPIIGEQLRRNRDMVNGWYDQWGKVDKMRFHANDPRTGCKVCKERNGKEYKLLDTNVIARILPPSHDDMHGKRECLCTVHPVVAGDRQVAGPTSR